MNDPQSVDLGQLVATVAKAWGESNTSPQKLIARPPGTGGTTFPTTDNLNFPGGFTIGLIATPPIGMAFPNGVDLSHQVVMGPPAPQSARSNGENDDGLTQAISAAFAAREDSPLPSKVVGNGSSTTSRPRDAESPTSPANPKTAVDDALEGLVRSNLITSAESDVLTGALSTASSGDDGHVDLSALAFAAARGELTSPLARAIAQVLTLAAQKAHAVDGAPSPQKMKVHDLVEGCLLGAAAGAGMGVPFEPEGPLLGGVLGCVFGGLNLGMAGEH